MLSIFQQ